jgi:hypothetical protein
MEQVGYAMLIAFVLHDAWCFLTPHRQMRMIYERTARDTKFNRRRTP